MTSQPTTYAEPVTFNFNLTFTRPDEQDAHVYRCGVAIDARDRAEADRKLQARHAHLTLTEVTLFAVVNNEGDVLEDYRQAATAATDLARALDPNDPDFATRTAAIALLSDEYSARRATKKNLLAELDALREQLAFQQEAVREAETAWFALHSEKGLTNEQLGAWLTRLTATTRRCANDRAATDRDVLRPRAPPPHLHPHRPRRADMGRSHRGLGAA